jgi:hypothetical protein
MPFHGKIDIAVARITGDNLELGAEQIVRHYGIEHRRGDAARQLDGLPLDSTDSRNVQPFRFRISLSPRQAPRSFAVDTVIGGTSAVAPLWAGLIARINAARASGVGFINPQLYASASCLHDVTGGNNGDYSASVGWDACSGLGSPDGKKIAGVLGAAVVTS